MQTLQQSPPCTVFVGSSFLSSGENTTIQPHVTDSNLYDITYMKYRKRKDETPSGEKSEGQKRELEKDVSRFSYFAWRLKTNQILNIHTFYCMQIILQFKKKVRRRNFYRKQQTNHSIGNSNLHLGKFSPHPHEPEDDCLGWN